MHRLTLAIALLTATVHAQWTLQDSHTTASLRGIDNVGNGIAWASGTQGTVLHTTDNGAHWQHCTTPSDAEKLDFRGIQAFDANTAIVMSSGPGDASRLYKTTDACETWKLVFTNPEKDGFWDTVRFCDKSPGYDDQRFGVLVGDPVDGRIKIYFSYHFGTDWEESTKNVIPKEPAAREHEAFFAASNSVADVDTNPCSVSFITGGRGGSRYFHEVPGGLVLDSFASASSFETTPLPLRHTLDSEGAFSMAHRTNSLGDFDTMIVGGDYSHPDAIGAAVFLPNATYKFFHRTQKPRVSSTPPHGYRSAVAYSPTHKTWITVGPNGTDISTDDGRNWRPLEPGPQDPPDADKNWNALSLPFVVGPHGRIGILRDTALPSKP